jgi:phospholipid/cholesterol/gamma-HCH transport system substrate-binding protein
MSRRAPDASDNGRRHGPTERTYLRTLAAGVVALVLVCIWAFADGLPFGHHFEVNAVVPSAMQMHAGDPVRVAGLQVGEVTRVSAGPGGTATLRLRLDANRSDVRADATLAVKPRLFFEGNNYVLLHPGTPSAARLADGATIPLERTATSVQFDQVLSTFTASTRRSFKRMFGQLSQGLSGPAAAPSASGAAGMRDATVQLDATLDSAARAALAARGQRPGDLHGAIESTAATTGQLARDPQALADLVTNYNRVFAAFADRDRQLGAGLRELAATFAQAPQQLRTIDASLPAVARFAGVLRPALHAAPAPLRAADRLVGQLGAISKRRELPALLDELGPTAQRLPALERQIAASLAPLISEINGCLGHNVVPALEQKVDDGPLSTNAPVWLDFLHLLTALAGASPNFDGNGTTIRLGLTESELALTGTLPNIGQVIGRGQIEGLNPAALAPGATPPWRPDAPCSDSGLPDLNARKNPGPGALGSLRQVRVAQSQKSGLDLSALFDGPAARHALLRTLLSRFPLQSNAPRRQSPSPSAAIDRKPQLPSLAGKPAAPAPAAKPLPEPKQVVDAVGQVLDGLLGPKSALGGLLGGRNRP